MCHFRCPWNGIFDCHQAEISVMQFTGHSLPVHQSMTVLRDFTLSHIVSQARLRQWNMQLPRLWNGTFDRVEGQYKTPPRANWFNRVQQRLKWLYDIVITSVRKKWRNHESLFYFINTNVYSLLHFVSSRRGKETQYKNWITHISWTNRNNASRKKKRFLL